VTLEISTRKIDVSIFQQSEIFTRIFFRKYFCYQHFPASGIDVGKRFVLSAPILPMNGGKGGVFKLQIPEGVV
jgi:hypothetical protein